MQWGSISEFIAMGGYGGYVWGAFGVTFVLMAGEVVMVVKGHRDSLHRTRLFAKRGDDR
jgi:heme exporter protein D